MSRGVVSGLSRSIVASDSSGNAEQLSNIIQTDAAINPGNSGGPLLDINGRVIGVNVATATRAESIGFAIPSNVAIEMIEDVEQFGEVRVPFVGVRYSMISPASDESTEYGVDYGALIVEGAGPSVVPGSPAESAGLEEGDVILQVDEQVLTVTNPLADALLEYESGDEVTLTILRDGEESQVPLTLADRPE